MCVSMLNLAICVCIYIRCNVILYCLCDYPRVYCNLTSRDGVCMCGLVVDFIMDLLYIRTRIERTLCCVVV